MKHLKLTFILSLLFTSLISYGQKLSTHIGEVPNGYNFWLYTPDASLEEESEEKPVIIFLHGASLCGNDLNKVTRYGTINAIQKGFKPDAYVIAPQNPGGSWNPERIMNVFDYVADNHNIDYDRIYVLGMSLGGYGTIDMVARYPDFIAAAMAFCGGGTERDLSGLNEVPLWIVHGTADQAVNVSQSDRVVQIMRSLAGGDAPRLIYDRVPGMNHGGPARLFYLPETYKWLMSHSLKDEDRVANEGFELSSGLLKSAYKNFPGKRSSSKSSKSTAKSKSGKKSSGKAAASKSRKRK